MVHVHVIEAESVFKADGINIAGAEAYFTRAYITVIFYHAIRRCFDSEVGIAFKKLRCTKVILPLFNDTEGQAQVGIIGIEAPAIFLFLIQLLHTRPGKQVRNAYIGRALLRQVNTFQY